MCPKVWENHSLLQPAPPPPSTATASSPAPRGLAPHLWLPARFQTRRAAALLPQGCTREQGHAWERAVPTPAPFPAQVLALFSPPEATVRAPSRGHALTPRPSVFAHLPATCCSNRARDQADSQPVRLNWSPSSLLYGCQPQPLRPPAPRRSLRDPGRALGGTHPPAPGLLEEPPFRRANAHVRARCRRGGWRRGRAHERAARCAHECPRPPPR